MTDQRGKLRAGEIQKSLTDRQVTEDRIDKIMVSCFATDAGKQALTYLKNVYWNTVPARGSPMEQIYDELGSRRVVGDIMMRIERGTKAK